MAYYNQPAYVGYGTAPNQGVGYSPAPQQAPAQLQSNGMIQVKSKEEAFYWPCGPGVTMIFMKDDGNEVYIKSMGFNVAEPPKFDEFVRFIPEKKTQEAPLPDFQFEIDKIWGEINALKNRSKPQNNKRREDGGDRDV